MDSPRGCVNTEGYTLLQPAHHHFNYWSSNLRLITLLFCFRQYGFTLGKHRSVHVGFKLGLSLWIQQLPLICMYIYRVFATLQHRAPCLLWCSRDDIIIALLTGGVFLLRDHGIVLHLGCLYHHLTSEFDKVESRWKLTGIHSPTYMSLLVQWWFF